MEAALSQGMRIGLVSTTVLADATPASFSAHATSRSQLNEIARKQIEDLKQKFAPKGKNWGLDIIFGGGRCYYAGRNTAFTSCRYDDWDGVQTSKDMGYQFATNKNELFEITKLPAMGLFADTKMKFTIDRDSQNELEPTLTEMSQKALDLISPNNENGFLLMIEGARIDHAGHSNDIAAHYREIIEYNQAVETVLRWAEKDNNTLVISTADHETGGLTLGRTVDGVSEYVYNYDVVLKITKSTETIARNIVQLVNNGTSRQDAIRTELINAGLSAPITNQEVNLVGAGSEMYGVDEVINRRARIGFSTTGHTGVDVNVYAFGPSRELFIGNQENTNIGEKVAGLMNFDLASITSKLNS